MAKAAPIAKGEATAWRAEHGCRPDARDEAAAMRQEGYFTALAASSPSPCSQGGVVPWQETISCR